MLGTDQRRNTLGKEKLVVINSTVVPNIIILFPPTLKGNNTLNIYGALNVYQTVCKVLFLL